MTRVEELKKAGVSPETAPSSTETFENLNTIIIGMTVSTKVVRCFCPESISHAQ